MQHQFLSVLSADFSRLYDNISGWSVPFRAVTNASFRAVVWIRISQRIPSWAYWLIRRHLLSHYGIDFARSAVVAPGLSLPHPTGIVIGQGAFIGYRVTIYQHVTVGEKNGQYPKVEDDVTLWPGCLIVGNITIGQGACVGANLFIDRDIAAGEIVTHA
jgi:serine O-acetyltransferase